MAQAIAATDEFERLFDEARGLERSGRRKAGIDKYRQALTLRPRSSVIHYNIGNLLMEIGRNDDAIASYRQAIEIRPKYVSAWCNLGIALSRLGRLDEAIEAYERALEIDPKHRLAMYNMAGVLKEDGQTRKSALQYEKFVQAYPEDEDGWLAFGLALSNLDHYEHAEEALREAVNLNRRNGQAYLYRGLNLVLMNRRRQAIEALVRSVALQPTKLLAWQALAVGIAYLVMSAAMKQG